MSFSIDPQPTQSDLYQGAVKFATVKADGSLVLLKAPAFDVFLYSNLNVSSGVQTKVPLNVEVYDTANCFDTSLNRFQPNVAGIYQINVRTRATASGGISTHDVAIYKNGTFLTRLIETNTGLTVSGSHQVMLNGTTDYIELYGNIAGSGTCSFETAGSTVGAFGPRMSGHLVLAI